MSGRPTKRCPELENRLAEVLGIGGSVVSACKYAGISRDTYYEWCKSDQSFSDRMEMLQDTMILKALKTVEASIEDPKTAQWYLEKRHKDFRPKQTVEHETPQPVTVVRKVHGENSGDS